jgi:hypothetical protein
LSSTASENTLAPVAWSANIAWSHDVDEVFGTHNVRMPPMNSIMERWIQTRRRELLNRTLILNQRHLLRALRE